MVTKKKRSTKASTGKGEWERAYNVALANGESEAEAHAYADRCVEPDPFDDEAKLTHVRCGAPCRKVMTAAAFEKHINCRCAEGAERITAEQAKQLKGEER